MSTKIETSSGDATPDDEARAQFNDSLTLIQKKFGLIKLGGRIWGHDRPGSAALDGQGTAHKLVFYNRGDLALLMTRALKKAGLFTDCEKVVKDFFTHPATLCYEGLEFNPRGTTPHYLNLWIGPSLTPRQGRWPLIHGFLLEVICDGNRNHFAYLLRYIAHALQRPWEKPGVIVVLVGGQGIGKGRLGRILRRIWASTYLHVYRTANVTGNFNADLERAFVVFLDEALFAGDRAASDALKSLVTEEVIHINEKHQPSRQVQSFHRFVIATNSEHVKHTDRDDRRDFVLRVSELRKGDFAYWAALSAEIENGGVEAMAHDLLALDLSDFNVRAKPGTGELVQQKLLSLDPVGRYWHELLLGEGQVDCGDWPDFIRTDAIVAGAVAMASRRLFRNPSASEVIKTVLRMCPSATKGQKQDSLSRGRGLFLPSLDVARHEFEAFIGGEVTWD
jgi:hypothetical protein